MFKIELSKLLSKKSTKTLMVIYSVILLGILGVYTYGEFGLNLSIYNSGQFVTASLNTMMAVVLPFIVLYLSSQSFVTEFKDNTFKNLFLLPVKKSSIYLSKLLSVQAVIAMILGSQFILTSLVGILVDGFSLSLVPVTYYLGAFLVLGLINMLSSLLSMIFNSTGIILIVSYFGFLGLNILGYVVPKIKMISISHMLGGYQMILTSLTLLLSVIAYYILLYIAGYQLFEKKEAIVCQSE